jgi:PKD domain-containing protein
MRGSRVCGFVVAAALAAGCTVHDVNEPPLTGPSEMAMALNITATPDRLAQDGISTSTVAITALDFKGLAVPNLELRLQIFIGDQLVNFGSLSSPTVFTNSAGRASTTFTAPLAPAFLAGGPSKIISIVATIVGTNYSLSSRTGRTVEIQVTPPPAPQQAQGSPVAILQVSSTTPKVGATVTFDGTKSYAEPGHSITAWYWDFGDGLTNDEHGNDASHIYVSPGTYYAVLGVVDDVGRIDSDIKTIVVSP